MTKPTKPHVLCAVDFSTSSRTALRYAAVVAGELDARLTVVTVNDPLLVEAMRAYGSADWPDVERKELHAFCLETIGADSPLEVEVRVGRPATEILRLVSELPADLLVMGCHGLTGVRKLFFGSTTERVLRASDIPVLVTPTNLHAPISARDLPALVRRILVPVDLTEGSGPLVRIGAGLGRAIGVPVLVAHAVEPLQFPPHWQGRAPSVQFEARDRAETALKQLADDAGGGPSTPTSSESLRTGPSTPTSSESLRAGIEPIVLFGDAAEIIVNIAEIRAAGLIVMGLQQSGSGRVGVVAYRVLSRTHVPVLALPQAAAARLAASISRQSTVDSQQGSTVRQSTVNRRTGDTVASSNRS